jgi:hypothetical protein
MCKARRTRVTSIAATADMVDSSSRATLRIPAFILLRVRPAGGADGWKVTALQAEVCGSIRVGDGFSPSLFVQRCVIGTGCSCCGCLAGLRVRHQVRLPGALLAPCGAVNRGLQRATTTEDTESALQKPRLKYPPTTPSMPGKHIAGASDEPCRRCKDNISVLVVRSEPLCQ